VSAMRAAADNTAAPSAAAPQSASQAIQRACGLGLTVLPDPDCAGPYPLVVTAVSPYSFAKQVGCGLGDVVKRIDGIDTRGMPLPTLFQKLVGAVDSSVVLLLETVNGKQKMVTLRRTIPPPRILRRAEDYSNLGAAYALAGEW
jgi:C-terminal processing protease CtpA/Prc